MIGTIAFARSGIKKRLNFDSNDEESLKAVFDQLVGGEIEVTQVTWQIPEEQLRAEWQEAVAAGATELGFAEWRKEAAC